MVSTGDVEYGPTFTPAGDTLYFTRRVPGGHPPRIMWSVNTPTGWTEPQMVPFTHPAGDEFPSFSPDGGRLYFSSARPVDGVDQNGRNDIWYVERTGGGWSQPVHLGGAFSTPDVDSHPVVVPQGMFFHSRRAAGTASVDMYFAPGREGQWSAPVLLPFNSDGIDGEIAATPDGSSLVFYSEREGGHGRGDLYFVSSTQGEWGEPVNLGPVVNTAAWEWSPTFAPDGRLVFARFSEDGPDSDLYSVTFAPPGE